MDLTLRKERAGKGNLLNITNFVTGLCIRIMRLKCILAKEVILCCLLQLLCDLFLVKSSLHLSPNLSSLVVVYKNLWIYIENGKNRQFSLKQAFNLLQTARIMTAHIMQGHLFLALHSNYISGKTEILKLKSSEINLFQEKGLEFHFNFFALWGAIEISY